MLKTERHARILEHVSARGAMDVTELSRLLKVSGATIRRDLQQLSRQNLLRRTHGGAVLGGAALRGAGPELPVPHRSGHRRAEKQAIARAAAELVPEGAVVGMTGGTTVTEIARVLAARGRVTIVTNAVNIAAEMVPHKNVTLVVVGGSARTESYELVGPIAEKTLADHHTDVTFLGVDGVGADHGCTTHDQLEAATDRAFLASSDRTVVVADHSKIGRVTFAKICPLRDIDRLVTDAAAPAAVLADIMDAGVAVTVV
ncbi:MULTISPECIES: DeoR/GlpR family DNA-binding transcription regulator [Streptomyces]|jgi:DeoR family transcriptional regulator of aga operon|uniref:DeoR/GlpR transcriptional regulator n=2 Tax=Streptomyces griseoaurantiacus TaxID=68213 RepID=A0A7W2DWA1_9ACTN|nr:MULTISPECIES: DeoR/GlpR family DNA-binding transcription regulator [Streptomyces]MBA5223907.1 DeoR/GlpR transcriptional regulator [Streptomyces griseoaurantiacus]MDX3088779.1 DeoR/GlpR family DNA-binding transcription regulator [Streptomyces sp. ME12-02E]MDX3332128.1 DeoR/GlpR family DNA-binding transcription regulator [Streptomyces sp. ME02-6978a]MDX3361362.1 DeoR/GlpR family DNA-binding transcription regulator [Streptomyces sp. ME02-6978.2a]WTI30528.1 DeoR/GlpR family DNA-binding transcri